MTQLHFADESLTLSFASSESSLFPICNWLCVSSSACCAQEAR
jgi:hypothetical protein